MVTYVGALVYINDIVDFCINDVKTLANIVTDDLYTRKE